ncbi:MAG: septal ring lytic transglycosylase RlpA family protein [Gammaproteobacteria bacterium]|nr:septal ring lytic transglycosylase RlpA family protein [Gammaproteobacteria bacterium]
MVARDTESFGLRCYAPWVPCLGLCLVFAGCSQTPVRDARHPPRAMAGTPDPIRGQQPLSRYGNPESYEVFGQTYYPLKSSEGFVERGVASWYGPGFHRKRTSSREPYDMYEMSAAHRVLPLPTYVEVTHLGSGRRAVVKVNDRGPFKDDRVLDLSYAAAYRLGIYGPGTAWVEIRALSPGARTEGPGTAPMPAAPAQSRNERVAHLPGSAPLPLHHPARRREYARANAYSFHVGTAAQRGQLMRTDSTPRLLVSTSSSAALDPTPRKPPTASGGPAERGLFLQVGAFSEASNAERLRARIGAMLAPMLGTVHEPAVHIRPSQVADRRLYRVQIGPLVGTEMVERIGARLSNVGLRAHRVTADPL